MAYKPISYRDIKSGETYYQKRKVLEVMKPVAWTRERDLGSPRCEFDIVSYENLLTHQKSSCEASSFAKWMRLQERGCQ
jgi:hypothetical protein